MGSKNEKYVQLFPSVESLLSGENDPIASMANLAAVLKESFGWLWVGFYIVRGDELVLGPFQGSVACTRIGFGRGVCGAAWQRKATVVVDDVEQFEGHIACSSLSRSEIVVPLFDSDRRVAAVLDVDSDFVSCFDHIDRMWLERIAVLLLL